MNSKVGGCCCSLILKAIFQRDKAILCPESTDFSVSFFRKPEKLLGSKCTNQISKTTAKLSSAGVKIKLANRITRVKTTF